MASHGIFKKENGEAYVEFLVQQCAISDAEVERVQAEHAAIEKAMGMLLASPNRTEVVHHVLIWSAALLIIISVY